MTKFVSNRALANALMKRGLLPAECRLLEIRLEVDGALAIRYERLVPADELVVFAEALKEVGEEFST
jgi:hypothetical protein